MSDVAPQAATSRLYQEWLLDLQSRAAAYDLWQTLRHIDAAHPHLPRLGEAARPADEAVRVRQPAELSFPPGALAKASLDGSSGRVLLDQRVFGLLGSNGPLPLHLTEFIRERRTSYGDATLQTFVDMLAHRFALLFYRAWAQAQPVLALDRPGVAPLERWLGSLFGLGNETTLRRDELPDGSRLFFTGRLSRQVRDADGLEAWCRWQFRVPLSVRAWCGHWMHLAPIDRTRLHSRGNNGLGRGAVLGSKVWDVQHKFRIVIGPLRLQSFLSFLPGGRQLAQLQAMVRQWVGLEFEWDVQLILDRLDVPALVLPRPLLPQQGVGALGRSAWLGKERPAQHADQVVIDVEGTLRRLSRPSSTHRPIAESTP